MSPVPVLPESAPFTALQRQWLNGYLAGLLSNAADPGPRLEEEHERAIRERVSVLWGSQSGNAEGLARVFGKRLIEAGFDAPVVDMADYRDLDWSRESQVLLITSTWGEGDPPDNAAEFLEHLTGNEAPPLNHLRFAVLALGDSNYLHFCGAGRSFDQALEKCGASRIAARADCDVDFEAPAESWFVSVLAKLELGGSAPGGSGARSGSSPSIAIVKESSSASVVYSRQNPFPAPMLVNARLNAPGSERDTRHIALDLSGSGLTYEVGDVLGVIPKNCPEEVEALLDALGFRGDEAVEANGGGEAGVREALLRHWDLGAPGRKFLETWAERVKDAELRRLLQPGRAQDLAAFLSGRRLIDFAVSRRDHGLVPGELGELLAALKPRLYSISSSPRAHPGEAHLTVAVVTYYAHGRTRKGVCSTYLAQRVTEGETARVFTQAAKHFKLPLDASVSVIMCGPGTGVAPFRAFLEEREAAGAPGSNWLFFGNPRASTGFFYKDQFERWLSGGLLTRLDVAWSRDQAEKVYVQHRLLERGRELWRWIEQGAHFYVCGDAHRMAKDVESALCRIACEHGGMSEPDAAVYLETMKKQKRYQKDVY